MRRTNPIKVVKIPVVVTPPPLPDIAIRETAARYLPLLGLVLQTVSRVDANIFGLTIVGG